MSDITRIAADRNRREEVKIRKIRLKWRDTDQGGGWGELNINQMKDNETATRVISGSRSRGRGKELRKK